MLSPSGYLGQDANQRINLAVSKEQKRHLSKLNGEKMSIWKNTTMPTR